MAVFDTARPDIGQAELIVVEGNLAKGVRPVLPMSLISSPLVQQNSSLLPPSDHGKDYSSQTASALSASVQALPQLLLHVHDVLHLVASFPLNLGSGLSHS